MNIGEQEVGIPPNRHRSSSLESVTVSVRLEREVGSTLQSSEVDAAAGFLERAVRYDRLAGEIQDATAAVMLAELANACRQLAKEMAACDGRNGCPCEQLAQRRAKFAE